ncbi:hypothetical protein AKJ16_DCAP06205 [Drosera capensis]
MLQLPPSPHMPKSQKLIYTRRGLPCLNLRVFFRVRRMRKAVFRKKGELRIKMKGPGEANLYSTRCRISKSKGHPN